VQVIDNAAKYSPAGSPIRVSAKRNGSHVVFSVHDEGAGLTAEESAQIYERFFRGQRQFSTTSGSGLGLWIARAFVSANGGRIEAASAGIDHGTTVAIHLPFATPASVPEVGPDD
jgi:two-component system, OmpR family, sensor histidine kinase KdpD